MSTPRPSSAADPLQDRSLPAWFDDAKLGALLQWGPYSVPGWAPLPSQTQTESTIGEDYMYAMSDPGSLTERHHKDRYGDLPYEAFGERFREAVERWDPIAWADLFERAGMRYVIVTTKSEDSFLLWPSAHPHPRIPAWQMERDVIGELGEALHARGIRLGVYYAGEDWTFSPPGHPFGRPQSDEWIAYADAHLRELTERYRPALLWGDLGFTANHDWHGTLREYVSTVPDGVINDRFGPTYDGPELPPFGQSKEGSVYRDFQTIEDALRQGNDYESAPVDEKWESCRPIGPSWSYNSQARDEDHASTTELLHDFVNAVARGGNFVLGLGPTGAGEIPWQQARRIQEIGLWLKRYGPAIYGTRRWERPTGAASEGLDVRFTASEDAVHAIVLGTPTQASVELDIGLEPHAEAFLEDQPLPLRWRATSTGVEIDLPEPPDEQPAIALRLSPAAAVRSST